MNCEVKINCNIGNIDKIFQISDIHLRHYKRHKEYFEVFQELYEQINLHFDSSSIIVISGDIIHTKNHLVPEQIMMFADFLTSLADIGPTVIFAGNHDAMLNNRQRLDSITPTVKALNNPNIFYLKKSGLYEMGENIIFSNMSVFDPISEYIRADSINSHNRKKIALYHGVVEDAITDGGYRFKGGNVSKNFFDGFDMVLLGDIHAIQTIQKYEIETMEIDKSELELYLKAGWEIKI